MSAYNIENCTNAQNYKEAEKAGQAEDSKSLVYYSLLAP